MSTELGVEDVNNVAPNLINEGHGDGDGNGVIELDGNVEEKGEEEQVEEHDGDEDGDGEEDDGDGYADGAYTFRFEEGMDPLDFTEDDAFGNQPYQQFERLEHEYEALAAKKRKALAAHDSQRESVAKKLRLEDPEKSFEEIFEAMNYGLHGKSRKGKKRGRRKGSKNKHNPEVTKKLGEANIHYGYGRYEEALCVLKEVVRIAPNLPDPYHTFGLVYTAMGDKQKALNFYMLAALLTSKGAPLWKILVASSIEQGKVDQARYCLGKAITADPADISLRFLRVSLYVELKEYQKAAESYEQISQLSHENDEALKTATMSLRVYYDGGNRKGVESLSTDFLPIVNSLAALCMENGEHSKALKYIEHAHNVYCGGKALPPYLTVKAGICHAHLGDIQKAEITFSNMRWENVHNYPLLLGEVADSFMALENYESALEYYLKLEGEGQNNSGLLHDKIARCYLFLKKRVIAIEHFYKALHELEDNIDARLTLATLLLEEDKGDEAISILLPPKTESNPEFGSANFEPWWLDGRIRLKLCRIYHTKGEMEAFANTIFPSVRESLFIETNQKKSRVRKKLPKSVLLDRIKVLGDDQTENLFYGFRTVASSSELSKASRAKKKLQKDATLKEERKTVALAAGHEWKSDDSDEDTPQATRRPPLPNLLRDEEHHQLIIDLCKALASLRRFSEAMEVINLTLKLASNSLSIDKKEELRSLGAQIAYNMTDPTHGWDYARDIVNQHPYSFAAWNCYYKVISRLENRFTKHNKFLHGMRVKHKDSIPPIVISGHQLTMISQHQAAAREYLEAHKLMPDCPLINLSVGTALINLALGFRLQNKHQCLLQGLAFLYNNLRLCKNSQEALYNIARAYHHVGLVTLAAAYYEKVIATHQEDFPIPKLPNENRNSDARDNQKQQPGYCDLRREAAYCLHLIYKKSGALDLARQILKDHCIP